MVSLKVSLLVGFWADISLASEGLIFPPFKIEIFALRRSSVLALSSSTALILWLC
jgi:hypothetical protein